MKILKLIFALAAKRFSCKAVTFDGNNDYGDIAVLTGVADGKEGFVSFWVKSNQDAANTRIMANHGEYFSVQWGADNKITLVGYDDATNQRLDADSSAITVANGWTNIMASWNMAGPTVHLYKNNVDDATVNIAQDAAIDYLRATTTWAVGANVGGGQKLDADLAELIFDDSYLDISQASNRAKIIDPDTLKPIDPGTDGSKVLGSQPLIYLSVRPAEAASAFFVNRGSGGNFTDQGSLALAGTSPTD